MLDEWGTSGRVLPTLGHLLYLLTKAKLFRAADYIAVSLLNQSKPKRPEQGPEAAIPIDIPNTPNVNDKLNDEEIEKILDEIDYPSSAVERILSLNLQNTHKKTKPAIPKIVITPNNEDDNNKASDFSVPIVKPKDSNKDMNHSVSDMIKFSMTYIESQTTPIITNQQPTSKSVITDISENNCNGTSDPNNIGDCNTNILSQVEIPEISKLLNNESSTNLPAVSLIQNSKEITLNSSEQISGCCNPALSDLLYSEVQISQENIPNWSALDHSVTNNEISISSDNIPNLSALQLSKSEEIVAKEINSSHFNGTYRSICMEGSKSLSNSGNLPDFNALHVSGSNPTSEEINQSLSSSLSDMPDFNAIQSSGSSLDMENKIINKIDLTSATSEEKIINKITSSFEIFLPDLSTAQTSSAKSKNISTTDSNSRPCNSPLPELSLNTQLPHFKYNELAIATNNFNEDLYIDEIANGRFLGSGAFGSVFLAYGLLDKPVAVKKLVLENVDYVDVDATVTKQFRNEVEVLSHYRHSNLLSLVGYSCDGCTYCLLYEYIQGGALNVRLQVRYLWQYYQLF